MKSFGILFTICLYVVTTNAQEINYELIKGTWEYKSPKGKNKLSYKFDVDKKFSSTMERKGNESITEGTYEFDKKGDLDRLKLTPINKENNTHTLTIYHLIKPAGADTIKLQMVNDKQTTWFRETRRNTMIFVRKKEKPKESAN